MKGFFSRLHDTQTGHSKSATRDSYKFWIPNADPERDSAKPLPTHENVAKITTSRPHGEKRSSSRATKPLQPIPMPTYERPMASTSAAAAGPSTEYIRQNPGSSSHQYYSQPATKVTSTRNRDYDDSRMQPPTRPPSRPPYPTKPTIPPENPVKSSRYVNMRNEPTAPVQHELWIPTTAPSTSRQAEEPKKSLQEGLEALDRYRNRYDERDGPKETGRRDRDRPKDREREKTRDRDAERGREQEKARDLDLDREKERQREREKEREREQEREKERERIREREREKEKERERERERLDREREREKLDREREREKERERTEREREREKEKERERERERLEQERECEREKEKERERERENLEREREREREREKLEREREREREREKYRVRERLDKERAARHADRDRREREKERERGERTRAREREWEQKNKERGDDAYRDNLNAKGKERVREEPTVAWDPSERAIGDATRTDVRTQDRDFRREREARRDPPTYRTRDRDRDQVRYRAEATDGEQDFRRAKPRTTDRDRRKESNNGWVSDNFTGQERRPSRTVINQEPAPVEEGESSDGSLRPKPGPRTMHRRMRPEDAIASIRATRPPQDRPPELMQPMSSLPPPNYPKAKTYPVLSEPQHPSYPQTKTYPAVSEPQPPITSTPLHMLVHLPPRDLKPVNERSLQQLSSTTVPVEPSEVPLRREINRLKLNEPTSQPAESVPDPTEPPSLIQRRPPSRIPSTPHFMAPSQNISSQPSRSGNPMQTRALQPPIAVTSQESQATPNLYSDAFKDLANRTDGPRDQRSYSERPAAPVPTKAEQPSVIAGKHSIGHSALNQLVIPDKPSIDATPKEAPRAIFPEGYSRSRLNSLTSKPEPLPSPHLINTVPVFFTTIDQTQGPISSFPSIGRKETQDKELAEPEILPAPVLSVPTPTELQCPAPHRRESSAVLNPLVTNHHSHVPQVIDDARPSSRMQHLASAIQPAPIQFAQVPATPQVMSGFSIQRPPTATGHRDGSRPYVSSILASATQGTDSPDSAQTPSHVQSKFKAPDTPLLARATNNYYVSVGQGPIRAETPTQHPPPNPVENASFPPRVAPSDSQARAAEQNNQERIGVAIAHPPTSASVRPDIGKVFQHRGPIVATLSANPEVIRVSASIQPQETPVAAGTFNSLYSSAAHTTTRIENTTSQSASYQIWNPRRVEPSESQTRVTESNDRIVASVGRPSTAAGQREDYGKVSTAHTYQEASQQRADSQPTTFSVMNAQTLLAGQTQTRMDNSISGRYPYPSLSVRPLASSGQSRAPELGDRPRVEVHTTLPSTGESSGQDNGKSGRPSDSLATAPNLHNEVSPGPPSAQAVSSVPPTHFNLREDGSPGSKPRQHVGNQIPTVSREDVQRTRVENSSQGPSTYQPIQSAPSNREGDSPANSSRQHVGMTPASSALPREESYGIRFGNISQGPLSAPAQLSMSGPSTRVNTREDDSPRSRARQHPGAVSQNTATTRDEGYSTRVGHLAQDPSGAQPFNSGSSNRPVLQEDDSAGGKLRQDLSVVPQNVTALREEAHSFRIGSVSQGPSNSQPSNYGLSNRMVLKEDDSPRSKPGQPMSTSIQNSTATSKDNSLTARLPIAHSSSQRPSTPTRPVGYIHPNSSSGSTNLQPAHPTIPSSTIEVAPAPNFKQESPNVRTRLTNFPSTSKVDMSNMQMPASSAVKQESPRMQSAFTAPAVTSTSTQMPATSAVKQENPRIQSTFTAPAVVHPLLPSVNLENVPYRQRRDSKQDSPRTRTENRPSGSPTKPPELPITQETSLPSIANPTVNVESSNARADVRDNITSQAPMAASSRMYVPKIQENAVPSSGLVPQSKTLITPASNAYRADTGLYAGRSTPQVTSLSLSIDPVPLNALTKTSAFSMHIENTRSQTPRQEDSSARRVDQKPPVALHSQTRESVTQQSAQPPSWSNIASSHIRSLSGSKQGIGAGEGHIDNETPSLGFFSSTFTSALNSSADRKEGLMSKPLATHETVNTESRPNKLHIDTGDLLKQMNAAKAPDPLPIVPIQNPHSGAEPREAPRVYMPTDTRPAIVHREVEPERPPVTSSAPSYAPFTHPVLAEILSSPPPSRPFQIPRTHTTVAPQNIPDVNLNTDVAKPVTHAPERPQQPPESSRPLAPRRHGSYQAMSVDVPAQEVSTQESRTYTSRAPNTSYAPQVSHAGSGPVQPPSRFLSSSNPVTGPIPSLDGPSRDPPAQESRIYASRAPNTSYVPQVAQAGRDTSYPSALPPSRMASSSNPAIGQYTTADGPTKEPAAQESRVYSSRSNIYTPQVNQGGKDQTYQSSALQPNRIASSSIPSTGSYPTTVRQDVVPPIDPRSTVVRPSMDPSHAGPFYDRKGYVIPSQTISQPANESRGAFAEIPTQKPSSQAYIDSRPPPVAQVTSSSQPSSLPLNRHQHLSSLATSFVQPLASNPSRKEDLTQLRPQAQRTPSHHQAPFTPFQTNTAPTTNTHFLEKPAVSMLHAPSEETILMTPSSLARSTMLQPTTSRQSMTPSVTSQSGKKGGLFSMFRKTPTPAPTQQYEIWHPNIASKTPDSSPGHVKATHTPPDAQAAPPSPKRREAAVEFSIPVPIHGQPERKGSHSHSNVFTPFKYLTTRRNRAVSVASVEAQDGTATNTVVGSPTASMHSQAPILPPPARDPWQATQEWRNKEEADAKARAKARLRRQRPGVVFDVGEEVPEDGRRKPTRIRKYRSSTRQPEQAPQT